jgi:translocation and assembly module TamB
MLIKRVAKIVWVFFISLLVLVMIVSALIHLPFVQKFGKDRLVSFLSNKTGTKITIEGFSLFFPDDITLQHIYIEDQQGDTLLYAEQLSVDISFSQLIDRTIKINKAYLQGTKFFMSRDLQAKEYNFQFIIDSFKSDSPSNSAPWEFLVQTIFVKDSQYDLDDPQSGIHVKAEIGKAQVDVDKLGRELKFNSAWFYNSSVLVELFEGSTNRATENKKNDSEQDDFLLSANTIKLKNSEFSFNNRNANPSNRGIDWDNLFITSLNSSINNLSIVGNKYSGVIREISFEEKSGFKLKQLASDITLNLPALEIELQELQTPFTDLSGLATISFSNVLDILNQNSNTQADINLSNSKIATSDLLYFLPDLDTISLIQNKILQFDLNLKGNTDRFEVHDLQVFIDQDNLFKGSFELQNLLTSSKTYIDGNIKELKTQGNTLQQFAGQVQGFDLLALGNIKSKGKIRGKLHDFMLNLDVNTDAGKLKTDLAIGLDKDNNLSKANGNIAANSVSLKRLLQQDKLGEVSGYAQFETRNGAVFIKQSKIDAIDFNQYTYHDISIVGTFKDKVFEGKINSNDKNAHVDLDLKLNLSDSSSYQAHGEIKNIDFFALNFFNDHLTMHGRLNTYFSGNNIDNIVGFLNVDSLTLSSNKYEYFIDSVKVATNLIDMQRDVKVLSGFFNADFTGNFTFSEFPVAVNNFVSRYYSGFDYQQGSEIDSLDFEVNIKDTKGLLRMFVPEIKELDGLALTGTWKGKEQYLRSDLNVKQLEFEQAKLTDINFFVDANKQRIDVRAHSGPLALTQGIRINKPDINGYIVKDSFFFHIDLQDSTRNSGVDIQGLLALEKDTFHLTLDKILLELKNNTWKSDGIAKAVFSSKYLDIQNFKLAADTGQSILIYTERNENTGNTLIANLENVHLDELSKIAPIGFSLEGIVNSKTRIDDLMNKPTIVGEIKIQQFRVDHQRLGDLRMSFEKHPESPNLEIFGKLIEEIHELDVKGYVDIMSDTNYLDFKILGRQFQLASIQPFLKEYLFDLDGLLDTRLQIDGSIQEPSLSGEFHFIGENKLGIQATKTVYSIKDEKLFISNSIIDFGKITLFDKHKQRAYIEGNIKHSFLKDFSLDIRLYGKNFLFLDSKEEGLIPFYGKLAGELDMEFKGPVNQVVSKFKLVTNENTDISMALLTNQATYTNPEYIRFLDPDTVNYSGLLLKREPDKDSLKKGGVNPNSFSIFGEVEITKKAKVNIVIDQANGDKIAATGQGSFQFQFDSEGEMNLFGTYEVDKGAYTFTFMDIIKREFEIDKGSTISWQGDPTEGIMNVTAKYKTKASVAALMDDGPGMAGVDSPKPSSKPMSVTVFLLLKGELTAPEITFNIEMSESIQGGFSDNMITERLNQIKSEDGELNKQVMGIIAFNQFLPYQGWDLQNSGETGNLAASSVSKALNAQLGLLSDKLGGVDIQVGVENSPDLSMDRFNLMATKQFSERLSVSVGGNFGQSSSGQSNTVFAGDYIVYYQLNKSGSLSLKIFSKSNPESYFNYVQQISGVTIQHTKQFDHFKNLFN